MEAVVNTRHRVLRFLYDRRVESPDSFFDEADLDHCGEAKMVRAALVYGVELGYIRKHRGHYRLTAPGMDYCERKVNNGD